MKQLYAAGPLANGAPLNRSNGPNGHGGPAPALAVRAASAGVRPEQFQAALAVAHYTPPTAIEPTTGRALPVRLALVNTSGGRLLAHVAPNGETYFAHTLLNVPATADAQLAIQTWGSPFWQRHEPDSAADLPELPYLPVAGALDDDALRGWLEIPSHRDTLEFVLTALLGTPPGTRIILAAPADDVARVVYAVTRVLPPGLLDDFTFSTYEPDPFASPARLVGFDPGPAEGDLPPACYTEGAAFNLATGRRTEVRAEVPFAAFAVSALLKGDWAALDDVKATWQRLGLKKDARSFDLVFRLTHGSGVLTREEAAEALQHAPLAAWLSARGDVLEQLLAWALEDRDFATGSFSWAVQALRQKPDALARLAQTVRELGLRALQAGDRVRTANALEVVLPMAAPARAHAVWGELLGSVNDPNSLAWEMRGYLLPRFVRFKSLQGAAGPDPALSAWLDVPADRLGEVLALDLPRAYQLAAGRACLRREGEPSTTLVRTLAGHPGLTLSLLLPEGPGGDYDRLVKLFEGLLAEAPSQTWFEDLLARAPEYPAELLNRFFEADLAAGKVDADRVIRAQGPRLLEVFAGQSGLDRVGSLLLASPPADLLHKRELLDFLGKLRAEPRVSDGLKARIAAVQAVRAYLDAPTFAPEALAAAAAALALAPAVVPPSARGEVRAAVAGELSRRTKADSLQADLEAVLVHFGGVLADGPSDLYENLLRDLRGRIDLGRHPDLVHALLAVALGATRTPDLGGKLEGLDGHAFAVAHEAARRGGNRLLNVVDRRAESWPKATRTQWGFLRAAVRPRGFRGFLRDTAFALAGAGTATLVWWAAQVLRG
jgi:hypothetical protein